jgi:hypothetical protein
MAFNYLDSSLRVKTLSFEEAADFNPQERFIYVMTISPGRLYEFGRPEGVKRNKLLTSPHRARQGEKPLRARRGRHPAP